MFVRVNFGKKKFVCAFWLSVHCIGYHMKSVVEQGFFHEFAFDKKVLKTFVKFRTAENVGSSNVVQFEFELRLIPRLWQL